MDHLRLKINNVDRIGLVRDISEILFTRSINIVSMEVELNTVYIEVRYLPDDHKNEIIAALEKIDQVTNVQEIDLMPHEERAEQLKTVLSSVSDGIIAIDNHAKITQYNPAAEKIVRIPFDQVIGHHVTEIFPHDIPLLDALQHGTVYNNREIVLDNTKSHYLASGRPMLDHAGRIIGAVAIIKDITAVRELVYTVTGQRPLTFSEIIYKSEAMKRVVTLAKTIARGDSTVLIRGETGTGKELFARALHASSQRSDKMFVPVNCAAIPDTLLESELFGYEDGAFTGASKGGKQGLFEFANAGTLFLDEIGELSSHLQAKLLRVLQDNKVRRIGSTREISVDVRIIAATNRNLEDMIAKDRFREDLYYRLNVIPLFLPPLKMRREDIPYLAQAFLDRFSRRLNKSMNTISETAIDKLISYEWPGNIRELENVIERAVNIVHGSIILAEHIVFDQDYSPVQNSILSCTKRSLDEILADVERDFLTQAVKQHRTSRQLGSALGLSHTAVLKKLRKYGLTTAKTHE